MPHRAVSKVRILHHPPHVPCRRAKFSNPAIARVCGAPDERDATMVTIEYIGRSATNAYRAKGTAIARATLLHLGIPLPPIMDGRRRPRVGHTGTLLMECFANEASPMDVDIA